MKQALFLLPLCLALLTGTAARADSDEYKYGRLNSAKFYGIVDALPQGGIIGTWLINGRQVEVSRGTEIEQKRGRIAPGVYVKVEGHHSGSMFVAEEIEVKRKRRS